MATKKGMFITFEGSDGSGKTTQIRLFEKYLIENNYSVVCTREPGGTPISEKIRALILDPENKEEGPVTEMFLFAAARAQHVSEKIAPALAEGKIVICDRFTDSSIAYQGYARGLGEQVEIINEYAMQGTKPDITFFLDLSPEKSRERNAETGKADRMELEKNEFHKKVYDGFKALCEKNKDRYVVIDASQSIESVAEAIIRAFNARIKA